MKTSLFFASMVSILLLVGCNQSEDVAPPIIDNSESTLIAKDVQKSITGNVIGFTEDMTNIFVKDDNGEYAFELEEALLVEEGDEIYIKFTENANGKITVTSTEIIGKRKEESPKDNQAPVEVSDVSEKEEENNIINDEEEESVKEVDDELPIVTEEGTFYGKADNHSVEIKTSNETNIFIFPSSMSSKIDDINFESIVNVSYYKNNEGQYILTNIEGKDLTTQD